MTTRSGVTYKAMEDRGTHAEGAPAKGQRTMGSTLPELATFMDMVRVMINDQERRAREIIDAVIERLPRNANAANGRERRNEDASICNEKKASVESKCTERL